METKRLILFVVFSFSLLLLWDSWQKEQFKNIPVEESTNTQDATIPSASTNLQDNTEKPESSFRLADSSYINVKTDLYNINISDVGGDIRSVALLNHKGVSEEPYQLLNDKFDPLLYVAQTGLLGNNLPTHKSKFSSVNRNYSMSSDILSVPLFFENEDIKVTKTYEFIKNSYNIKLIYDIENKSKNVINSTAYMQFIHDGESNQGSAMMPSFTGTAYYNENDKFTKLAFDDVNKESFSLVTNNGWIGIIQQYFASAWILPQKQTREFYSKKVADNI